MYLVFALLIAFAAYILDRAFSRAIVSYGEVLDKEFVKHPGLFILKVKDWSGKQIEITCDPSEFQSLEPGDGLQYYCHKGYSGIIHSHEILGKL